MFCLYSPSRCLDSCLVDQTITIGLQLGIRAFWGDSAPATSTGHDFGWSRLLVAPGAVERGDCLLLSLDFNRPRPQVADLSDRIASRQALVDEVGREKC